MIREFGDGKISSSLFVSDVWLSPTISISSDV